MADGVLAPVQWWPNDQSPAMGPSGSAFVARFRMRTGRDPSYVAAQAAAAGYLATAAHRVGRRRDDIRRWKTSTMLGDFALDNEWRQVGHHVTTIRWEDKRMTPAA